MVILRLLRQSRGSLAICLFMIVLSLRALAGGVEDPQNAEMLFDHGVASLQARQFQAAYEELKGAIRMNPRKSEAYIYLGIVENQLGRFADAAVTLQKSLQFNPDSDVAHYNLALSFLGLHETKEAERELRITLEHDPKNESANYNLGLLLEQGGQSTEACRYLEKARASRLNDLAVAIHLIDLYFKTGADARAQTLIADETRSDSRGTDSFHLGEFLIEKRRFTEAVPVLEKAQSLISGRPEITIDLARAYLGSGQPSKAIEILAPVKAEQATWEVYYLRGIACVSLDRREDAAKALLSALNMQPNEASVHYAFGELILGSSEVEGRQAGVREIEKAIDLSPHESKYYLALADYFFDKGDIPAAIRELKTATDLTPPSVGISATLAMAVLELDGPDAAKPFIDKTITLDPKAGAGYDLLGRYYLRLGDEADAANSYKRAVQLTPQNDIYFRDTAIALEKLGRAEEGLPFAEKSIKLRSDQVYNHYILGKLYSEVGRRSDAIHELELCVRIKPNNSLPYSLLAVLYRQAGKPDEAKRCWYKLKALKEQGLEETRERFAEFENPTP